MSRRVSVRTGLIGLALMFVVLAGLAADAPPKYAGRITKVDVQARTLTVQDAKGGHATLLTDEQTVIVLDGDEQATLDDLFEGDELVSAEVRQLSGGRLLLVRGVVTSAAPAMPNEPDEKE